MAVPVLGPDVNESGYKFTVNKKGQIRFGLGAVKGVGEGAVEAITIERERGGEYTSIFDLAKRVNLRAANKRALESLAYAGAFDSFQGVHRSQYFNGDASDGMVFLEKAIKYGNAYQENKNSAQQSLFGETSIEVMPEPKVPPCEPWGFLEQLKFEKDVVGIYISGHPLDTYKFEMNNYCQGTIADVQKIATIASNPEVKNREYRLGGIVTMVKHLVSKQGKNFGSFMLEDYNGSYEFALYGDDYLKFKNFMMEGWFLFVKGKVQERYGNNWEFKISNIQLLNELREKMVTQITLTIELERLNLPLIEQIRKIALDSIIDNPATCMLKISVRDTNEDIVLTMPSKKIKVNPSNQFFQEMEKLTAVQLKFENGKSGAN